MLRKSLDKNSFAWVSEIILLIENIVFPEFLTCVLFFVFMKFTEEIGHASSTKCNS